MGQPLLISGKSIDLLPDREAKTVKNWLKQRPEVKMVTRDRFIIYAKEVSRGTTK